MGKLQLYMTVISPYIVEPFPTGRGFLGLLTHYDSTFLPKVSKRVSIESLILPNYYPCTMDM